VLLESRTLSGTEVFVTTKRFSKSEVDFMRREREGKTGDGAGGDKIALNGSCELILIICERESWG
jgi:hypothetical protein